MLSYLSQATQVEASAGRELQIGGPDVLTYSEMLDAMAVALGKHPRPKIPVPFLTPWLSSLWIGLVTPVDTDIARGQAITLPQWESRSAWDRVLELIRTVNQEGVNSFAAALWNPQQYEIFIDDQEIGKLDGYTNHKTCAISPGRHSVYVRAYARNSVYWNANGGVCHSLAYTNVVRRSR